MADLKMPDINRVTLAGRLTRDPELRYIQSGTALCKVGLAVSRKFKGKDGNMSEETLFINVTVWGKSAEYVGEKIKKGDPVLVEGRLTSNEWEDQETGKRRTAVEVTADRVQSLSWDNASSPGGGNYGGYEKQPKPRDIQEPIPEDDIPF